MTGASRTIMRLRGISTLSHQRTFENKIGSKLLFIANILRNLNRILPVLVLLIEVNDVGIYLLSSSSILQATHGQF